MNRKSRQTPQSSYRRIKVRPTFHRADRSKHRNRSQSYLQSRHRTCRQIRPTVRSANPVAGTGICDTGSEVCQNCGHPLCRIRLQNAIKKSSSAASRQRPSRPWQGIAHIMRKSVRCSRLLRLLLQAVRHDRLRLPVVAAAPHA